MSKINDIIRKIEQYDKICFFTHTFADGDAISSSYALALAVKEKFPHKTIKWLYDPVYLQERFSYLHFDNFYMLHEHIDKSWLAIIGDVSGKNRVFGFDNAMQANEVICFDHHKNNIDFETSIFWHEPTYPASGCQAVEIALELNTSFTSTTALYLLYGIITDTGNYRFSTNDSRPHQNAIAISQYIDKDEMKQVLNDSRKLSKERIKFKGWVFDNVVVKNKVAYCVIDKKTQKKLGVTPDECVMVNLLSQIKNIEIWAFFVEYPQLNNFRCEYRSVNYHVNEFAASVGGGGHLHASGSRANNIGEVKSNIKKLIKFCVNEGKLQ